jgi:hypothetical protein
MDSVFLRNLPEYVSMKKQKIRLQGLFIIAVSAMQEEVKMKLVLSLSNKLGKLLWKIEENLHVFLTSGPDARGKHPLPLEFKPL